MTTFRRALPLACLAALAAPRAAADKPPAPAAQPEVVQTVLDLDNPESCAFSPDRRWLFVTNCASAEFGAGKRIGLVRGEGAISRLRVDADGRLTMENARLVTGLHTPLGIAVAPRAVGPWPAGSLFVCVGNALGVDAAGEPHRDAASLGTAVAVFSPDGAALGRIGLGLGSAVASQLGHHLLLPNGIAFDGDGRLVVADSGFGGDRLSPPVAAKPGLLTMRIGADGAVAEQAFTPVAGAPNGVAWDAAGRALLWVTCGGQGPEGGALYRAGEPVALGIGPCDGIVVTPAGTIVVSRFGGDLVAIRTGAEPQPIAQRFDFPSDIEGLAMPDGSLLVYVPEQEAWNPAPRGQKLRVLRLPPGF